MSIWSPTDRMKRLSLMVCAIWTGMLSGCQRTPPVVQVPVGSLSFPVVLIVGTSAKGRIASQAEVVVNAADLSLMRVERYSELSGTTNSDPPIVIDGEGTVCDMQNIKGEHGGFWMMANPTGQMPIRFTLTPRKESGVKAARALITGCRYLGRDLDQERKTLRCERISQATTMAEIMWIIDEVAEPPNEKQDSESPISEN